jgi:enterochelin esterase family protein
VRRLAINRLKDRRPDAAAVDRFLARHEVPIVEGDRCTFLWRGEADEVFLVQRIVGLPDRLPLRRLWGTDLWYLVLEVPTGSRINYQIEVRRGEHVECGNDPLNHKISYSPVGTSSVCFTSGYTTPDWTEPDHEARPGELTEIVVRSRALRRDCRVTLYLPARFRRTTTYPLLVVHDGGDFLQYTAAKTVLDNLIHRLDVAEVVAAFVHPQDRLVEYANSPGHARFLTRELLPRLEAELPLVGRRSGRCLLGSSFGAVASLATAYRAPDTYGALALMSGSFVFTDIGGVDHGGGPVFDPVVAFMNRYRGRPRRVADRVFMSCGIFEPLIVPNRSMVHTFESTGMAVRFVETRDGHDWENWRDTLRDALSWVYPGPQKLIYE